MDVIEKRRMRMNALREELKKNIGKSYYEVLAKMSLATGTSIRTLKEYISLFKSAGILELENGYIIKNVK